MTLGRGPGVVRTHRALLPSCILATGLTPSSSGPRTGSYARSSRPLQGVEQGAHDDLCAAGEHGYRKLCEQRIPSVR